MRTRRIAMAVLVGLSLTACAERAAQSAISKLESDIAAVRAEAEKIAPSELAALVDSVAAMKVRVEAGDHSGALMGARNLSLSARDLRANLATRRQQLTTAFTAASNEVPGQLDAVVARVAELGAMRRLPPGIDTARFATLRADAPTWKDTWTSATQAFDAGNLAEAMSKATQLKTKIADARRLLSMN